MKDDRYNVHRRVNQWSDDPWLRVKVWAGDVTLEWEEHKEHATQFTLGEALAIVLSLRGPEVFKNDVEYHVVKI